MQKYTYIRWIYRSAEPTKILYFLLTRIYYAYYVPKKLTNHVCLRDTRGSVVFFFAIRPASQFHVFLIFFSESSSLRFFLLC